MTHAERVARTLEAFETAMDRLIARVAAVPEEEAVRPPAEGGWSVAGIAWHVAAANDGFSALVDGSRPLARAPESGFVETSFSEVVALLPDRLDAPESLQPPDGVTMAAALERLRASRRRFAGAYRALPEARATWTIVSILGRLTVYQVGDWATAHVARHNAQAKRLLGR